MGVFSSSLYLNRAGKEGRRKAWRQQWAVIGPLISTSRGLGENITLTGGASQETVSIGNSQGVVKMSPVYDCFSQNVGANMGKHQFFSPVAVL